jgi:FMN phosphatase YigB (HAD superfamily)
MPQSFELALRKVGSPDPRTCALLDDQARVTLAARQMGFFTILVGKNTAGENSDTTLQKWIDLPGLLDGQI